MRALKYIIGLIFTALFWLLTLVIIAAFIAQFMEPEFKVIKAGEPIPKMFPLAVTWQDELGDIHCRGVWHYQLDDLRQAVPSLKLGIDDQSLLICKQSTEYLKEYSAWPVMFDWDEKNYWPFAHIDITETGEYSVSYSPDDDLVNRSLYSVSSNLIQAPRHQRYFGPGLAIRALPYSLGVISLLWLFNYFRKRSKNQSGTESAGS